MKFCTYRIPIIVAALRPAMAATLTTSPTEASLPFSNCSQVSKITARSSKGWKIVVGVGVSIGISVLLLALGSWLCFFLIPRKWSKKVQMHWQFPPLKLINIKDHRDDAKQILGRATTNGDPQQGNGGDPIHPLEAPSEGNVVIPASKSSPNIKVLT